MMDKQTLRSVQLVQLEIAKEIKRVCEENGISYFLVGGTLIGAVRHKGFIPWDDDLDMGMLRSEFERFLQIAPSKLNDSFFLQTWHSDKEYPFAFAKVRKKGTLFIEANDSNKKTHQEIFVDLFPYDNFPSDNEEQVRFSKKIQNYRELMYMVNHMTIWKRQPTVSRKILRFIKCVPDIIRATFSNREKIIADYEKEMNKYNSLTTKLVAQESGGVRFGKYPIKRDYIEKTTKLEFEGEYFECPLYYDAFLTDIYGNYMQLPPLEKQICTHNIIKVVL